MLICMASAPSLLKHHNNGLTCKCVHIHHYIRKLTGKKSSHLATSYLHRHEMLVVANSVIIFRILFSSTFH
jgi:hypothetical protein